MSPALCQDDPDGSIMPSETSLLEQFVDEVHDLRADFEQTLFDPSGELVDEPATGSFSLLRPDRFRWQQDTPFEEIYVADGETLWTYDVELEQVTRAPLSDLASSPAMLLSGSGTIGDGYAVTELPESDGLRWLELTPVDEAASDFLSARIAFAAGVPVALELVDGLQNLTRVEFVDIEVNPGLDPETFEFEPPAGVRIVGAGD